ncbi:putative Na(+)/H(+) antiporter C3A11.09 [Grifola frondosa]|uniref:Putative Na(+)/H(+) antiporter C3A11.09 n=1 Tax=Grifola frondosa TaxID=5627 RepID=A0A1C7LW58_GRIFR|nr:putative Na(+)/H(+) antiporter C3A11.09 [Grifola frondosa]
MKFDPFQVSIPHIVYAALGGFVVIFGMFSLFIRERLYIGEACWAFLFGVIIGPNGANIFNPRGWGGGGVETTDTITLEFTRVVLAIGVFAIGVELPKAYMARHWKSLIFLLVPVMTTGWFVCAGLIYALIPGLNFLSSLAVAACLTPTDPILAAAVVGGKYADKHVPAHLRHLLAAESACNDGAAYPFLFIALYLTTDPTTGKAISDWFLLLWLYQVIMGIIFGSLLGFAFRHLMKFSLLTIGVTTLLGSDDLLAAFSCGTAFAWDGFFNKQTEESVFSSVIDLLFNVAAFVWIPDIKTFREAVFSGHFGPMGIGAIFISTLAAEQLPTPSSPPDGQTQLLAATIQPIVAFMVLCSITTHGLSIPFFSLGRRVHTVSRTWSRHDTFGTFRSRHGTILPEWTTQTRHVAQGEDIVINRDTEAGQPAVERTGSETSVEPHTGTTTQDEKESQESPQSQDKREEYPPDGTEVLAEWREGTDKITEKRAGPGDEVEVEVEMNAYGPSPTVTESVRIAEDAAHTIVRDFIDKVRQAPEEVEQAVNRAEQGLHREAEQVAGKLRGVEEKAEHAMGISTVHKPDEDEDKGGCLIGVVKGLHPLDLPRVRSCLSKNPRSLPRFPRQDAQAVISRSQSEDLVTRRDDAIRRSAEPEVMDDRRGRPTVHHGSTSQTPSSLRSPRLPRHSRIDSMRSLETRSREMSPARSVRFADTPERGSGSGYNTPRHVPSSSTATPLPGSEAPSGDEQDDSPRSQVRFSLPGPGDKRS